MKTTVFTAAVLVLAAGCRPHKRINRDLLVAQICQALKDDDRIDETGEKKASRIMYAHIDAYSAGMPADSLKALEDFVYIRLQHECREFRDIVHQMNRKNQKNDFKEVDIEPESVASVQDCTDFFNSGRLKYLESEGDTAVVDITQNSWQDNFTDGTYSRLSLQRTSPEEFIITFIESNNKVRKNMSHPGDKYRYKIIKKEGNTYSMFVEVVGPRLRSLFKMYY